MREKWDAIVVGGGPAGSSAAAEIARSGFKVLVLDKKKIIGEPNHCGEGVSSHCLRQIGVTPPQPWIIKEVAGCKLQFPNHTEIRFTQKGYCIDRPSFDRFLAHRALNQGVELMTSAKVESLHAEQSGWAVKTDNEAFRARYLIGAGGALCPVAGYLKQRPRVLPAVQYKFHKKDVQVDFSDNLLQFHHHQDFAGGYAWVFDRGEEVSIGAGATRDLNVRLDRFCARLGVDPAKRTKTEGGPIPFLAHPLKIAFHRALLCGDSGGFIYPLTKGGVHGAVWSGKIAGEVISKALREDDSYRLSDYVFRTKIYPCRDRIHLSIPQAFFKFDNRIINTIGKIMDSKEYSEVPVGRFLKHFLACPLPSVLWGITIGFAVQRFYHHSNRFAW